MFSAAITPDKYGNCSPDCPHQLRRSEVGTVLAYGIKVLGDASIVTGQQWWTQVEK